MASMTTLNRYLGRNELTTIEAGTFAGTPVLENL